jgi:hypothetical protein
MNKNNLILLRPAYRLLWGGAESTLSAIGGLRMLALWIGAIALIVIESVIYLGIKCLIKVI